VDQSEHSGVRGQLLGARRVRAWRPHQPEAPCRDDRPLPLVTEHEARLTPAHQLQIALRQKLGVQQSAMQRAVGVVDLEPPAQCIKAGLRAGELAAGDRQRVDRPLGRQRRPAENAQFGIKPESTRSCRSSSRR
jgi:hypothetical protein